MNILYAAREKYNKHSDGVMTWEKYIKWSRLTQLTEVIGLDCMLNGDLVEFNRNSEEDWKQVVLDGVRETGFYTDLDFVLRSTAATKFNLLAVICNPTRACNNIELEGFDFMGYELVDCYYEHSALTNCGGFDETFLPAEVNSVGLIDNYEKATDISKRLYENNPGEDHADTNVIAIWRHKIIGA
ncbi:hypothetical protein J2T02_000422 [Chitinophaga terrae (ex Kim and Jung 2007)]|uniref:hypothetical protein n=1 Tax=Chitinophaga terrae (ex Kim and Jung 2007) TaxID=408074 RepID=UPI00277E4604|nr:hypothetical protein [Chitinophaga terrae (ex Kim and Jung 2007)]MDQ0105339.1 hypothetical protein [Chitinophaga terrae (ex Kim and Jung 2007)]